MVMCGAVAVPRLEKVPPRVIVTTTGTSPAPANDAGRVSVIRSSPKKLILLITRVGVIDVVPMVTETSVFNAPRTPLRWISRTVGTMVVPLTVVTLNGSMMQPEDVLVTLQTTARPPGPAGIVKMSGCETTIGTNPRNTFPLLLTTMVGMPVCTPMGTTN